MLLLTIALTAALIGGVVIGDHVLEIERPRTHLAFLYFAMLALVFATLTVQTGAAVS
jgi:hypothetical protein